MRLEPGKPVTISLLLFGHEGDWRPGLGHLVERYPDFFVVAEPRVPNLYGAFMCSGGFKPGTEIATDKALAEWKRQHVQTVEVHGTFPFYGRYLPLGEQWMTLADDRWHELRKAIDPRKPADDAPWQAIYAYVAQKSPPATTVAAVRDYIRRLHGHALYALVYFNPTEAWKPSIKANYPGDLVLNGDGRHVPEWYESLLVCPNPDSPWGKYLLDTFAKMMDLYPEADGFFMDQSTYDRLDYAHDDGWSIQDGRTGYRMGWAIDQFSRRCPQWPRPAASSCGGTALSQRHRVLRGRDDGRGRRQERSPCDPISDDGRPGVLYAVANRRSDLAELRRLWAVSDGHARPGRPAGFPILADLRAIPRKTLGLQCPCPGTAARHTGQSLAAARRQRAG